MPAELPHLRSDARDNRVRILRAARAAVAAEGLGVSVREIARRAGVGPATVYRRFPTKEALVADAFAEQMTACVAVVDAACGVADPWQGLCTAIEGLLVAQASDRGFCAVFVAEAPQVGDIAGERARVLAELSGLVRRAKECGGLRPDVVLDDLVLAVMANEGIRTASAGADVAAARRFAALVIEAFRARPDAAPLPAPVRMRHQLLPDRPGDVPASP